MKISPGSAQPLSKKNAERLLLLEIRLFDAQSQRKAAALLLVTRVTPQ